MKELQALGHPPDELMQQVKGAQDLVNAPS